MCLIKIINKKMIHNLEIYFTQNIKDEIKTWGYYSKNTSNEIELGDDENDYRLYFYYYVPKTNILYLRDGMSDNYTEHSQLFNFLLNIFHSSFVCVDLINDKVQIKNY